MGNFSSFGAGLGVCEPAPQRMLTLALDTEKRQPQRKERSLADGAFDGDCAVMRVNNPFGDRQAQPGIARPPRPRFISAVKSD